MSGGGTVDCFASLTMTGSLFDRPCGDGPDPGSRKSRQELRRRRGRRQTQPLARQGRGAGNHRPERRGQDEPLRHGGRRNEADRRPRAAGRRRHHADASRSALPAGNRPLLSNPQAVPRPVRVRELARRGRVRPQGRRPRRRSPLRRGARADGPRAQSQHAGRFADAARAQTPRARARSRASRPCCCSTKSPTG